MPWKVASTMSQREEFVALAQSEGVNMSELCLRSGISRKTGYKWLRRYLEGGEQRLDDLPKRPHNSPNRTGDEMEQLVVDLRSEHPTKGGHVLTRMLKDSGHNGVPSKSTVTAILRRPGASKGRAGGGPVLPIHRPHPASPPQPPCHSEAPRGIRGGVLSPLPSKGEG